LDISIKYQADFSCASFLSLCTWLKVKMDKLVIGCMLCHL